MTIELKAVYRLEYDARNGDRMAEKFDSLEEMTARATALVTRGQAPAKTMTALVLEANRRGLREAEVPQHLWLAKKGTQQ